MFLDKNKKPLVVEPGMRELLKDEFFKEYNPNWKN